MCSFNSSKKIRDKSKDVRQDDRLLVEGILAKNPESMEKFVRDYGTSICNAIDESYKKMKMPDALSQSTREDIFRELCENIQQGNKRNNLLFPYLTDEKEPVLETWVENKAALFLKGRIIYKKLVEGDSKMTKRVFYGSKEDILSLQPILSFFLDKSNIKDCMGDKMSYDEFVSEIYPLLIKYIEKNYAYQAELKYYVLSSVLLTYKNNYSQEQKRQIRSTAVGHIENLGANDSGELSLSDDQMFGMNSEGETSDAIESLDDENVVEESNEVSFDEIGVWTTIEDGEIERFCEYLKAHGIKKETFELYRYRNIDGLSFKEIEEKTGVKPNTASQIIGRRFREMSELVCKYLGGIPMPSERKITGIERVQIKDKKDKAGKKYKRGFIEKFDGQEIKEKRVELTTYFDGDIISETEMKDFYIK